LLNPIEAGAVLELVSNEAWGAQEKFDGRRLLLRKNGADVEGINRKGLVIGLPENLGRAIQQHGGDCVLDGESVGDIYHAFDLLELDGVDMRSLPYRQRLAELSNLLSGVGQGVIRLVETACATEEKRALLDQLRRDRKEGVVFKELNAPYTVGRPNSGGSQLKHKFCAQLSAVVAKVNSGRSVELRLLDKDGWQTCGNVTIPANQPIPPVGQVVEVRYLYAFKESGVLYQPVFLEPRTDVDIGECLASQLKFKADEEEEAG